MRRAAGGEREGGEWRHALEGLSHYKDAPAAADGGSDGETRLERVEVAVAPLFGPRGALARDADVTFVKLDCEGAELDLLARAPRGAWRDSRVERLVFEWSFTKAREMATFRSVVARLEEEGFDVAYEGRGSWDALETWPWHTDALIFASRDLSFRP